MHGEKPSAEYAKLRKESLESEFGNALTSRSKRLSMYYSFGPFLALYRAAYISYEVFKLTVGHFFIHDIKKRSAKVNDDFSYTCNMAVSADIIVVLNSEIAEYSKYSGMCIWT